MSYGKIIYMYLSFKLKDICVSSLLFRIAHSASIYILLFFQPIPLVNAEGEIMVNEVSIEQIHQKIKQGDMSCHEIINTYIERAKSYNGVCTMLVTEDGKSIPPAYGQVRAGSPIVFPVESIPASDVLPDIERYAGIPLDFGRMEQTVSDPDVMQQAGMRVGIPNAGQLNALETLNIRGERSVICKGMCDSPPGHPLPESCSAVCKRFSRLPDAIETAMNYDKKYGQEPDLEQFPLYCVPFSFKDVVDTKDMRTTGNADVNYAMDVPPFDAPIVSRLSDKGAIIYAKANAFEYNGGPHDPGGDAKPETAFPSEAHALSSWSGQSCNPYDTEREPRGSSSGSAVSVAANLAACSICEQSGGSCKGPASRNNVVSLLATHGIIPGAGGFPSQFIHDRLGVICKTVEEAVYVLDALKNQQNSYFDTTDLYTAIPMALRSDSPYSSYLYDGKQSLQGIRIGVVREYFVKHVPNDAEISDLINEEVKAVLRDKLGAELVESVDPFYPDDPDIPNMKYTFQDALAEVLPRHIPEFFSKKMNGKYEFAVPGYDVTSYDYLLRLTQGLAPLSEKLNLRRITRLSSPLTVRLDIERYLQRRGDTRVKDWVSLYDNSRWRNDAQRAAAQNWLNVGEYISDAKTEWIKMRFVAKLALLKVMHENDIDIFVAPESTLPPRRIGGPSDPFINGRYATGATQRVTALMGIPEITVPAGYVRTVYEPKFVLNEKNDGYLQVSGTMKSLLPNPMPVGILFWAGPGDEPILITVSSAYESVTQHRVPPPNFSPVSN